MAQPTTDPNQRATELYKKGNEFYDKGKFADAETMYRAAFELRQSFEIAGNLGDVEMIQGKPREAAEHLAFALREFPPSGKPAQKEALRKRLREAAALIGTVKVTVNMPDAEVVLDGKAIGKSPIE
ncbi:MAG TPA: tetratricopeptide repeat protein, partial [Polyangiaceae bacterium]|nr:tetratricopeptide repeat protein [Polyangiaceae bacterium]